MLADNGCLSVNDMVTDRLRRGANKKAGGRSLPLLQFVPESHVAGLSEDAAKDCETP